MYPNISNKEYLRNAVALDNISPRYSGSITIRLKKGGVVAQATGLDLGRNISFSTKVLITCNVSLCELFIEPAFAKEIITFTSGRKFTKGQIITINFHTKLE